VELKKTQQTSERREGAEINEDKVRGRERAMKLEGKKNSR
jgi:hypothetical protein